MFMELQAQMELKAKVYRLILLTSGIFPTFPSLMHPACNDTNNDTNDNQPRNSDDNYKHQIN